MTFVPENISFSRDQTNFLEQLEDYYRQSQAALNKKTYGVYPLAEVQNNEQYFIAGNPQEFRSVYRKVINFGALPNTALKSVAHGITNFAQCTFVKIYGTSTQIGVGAISLPYVNSALTYVAALWVDATSVNIQTNYNAAGGSGIVVLEYLRS